MRSTTTLTRIPRLLTSFAIVLLALVGACSDTVAPDSPVATLQVTPESQTLAVGQTAQLRAIPRDEYGRELTDRPASWSSSHPTVVSVSTTGLVQALRPGVAFITAHSEGKAAAVTVTVEFATPVLHNVSPAAVEAGAASLTLVLHGQHFAESATVTWNHQPRTTVFISATELRAQINATDLAAIATAQLRVVNPLPGGSSSAAVPFAVVAPTARSIRVAPSSITVTRGLARQYSAVVLDGNGNVLSGRPVQWSTENTAIATVDAGGRVTGVAVGSTRVRAESGGIVGEAVVIVREPEDNVVRYTRSRLDGPDPIIGDTTWIDASGVSHAADLVLGDATLTLTFPVNGNPRYDQLIVTEIFVRGTNTKLGEYRTFDRGEVWYIFPGDGYQFRSTMQAGYSFGARVAGDEMLMVTQSFRGRPAIELRYLQ